MRPTSLVRRTATGSSRGRFAGTLLVAVTAYGALTASPALAVARVAAVPSGCTGAIALDSTVVCSTAGSYQLDLPPGATSIEVSVVGAGGGGSSLLVAGGTVIGGRQARVAAAALYGATRGGSGAIASGTAALPPGTDGVAVAVGAGGAGAVGLDTEHAGGGGGGSAVWAGSGATRTALVIAGGGGGGGMCGFSSCTSAGAGGDAGEPGDTAEDPARSRSLGGAAGGANGTGGSGGSATDLTGTDLPTLAGGAGAAAALPDLVTGGTGAAIGGWRMAGNGGGGYAGGGGGGMAQLAIGVTSYAAGGGGGGASYRHPTHAAGVSFAVATTGSGVGGDPAPDNESASAGADGAVSVTFRGSAPRAAVVDLGVDAVVGTALSGTRATWTGSGLAPSAPYTLTMTGTAHPTRTLRSGTATSGSLTGTATLGTRACPGAGLWQLVLTTTDPDGATLTDRIWLVLDAHCIIRSATTTKPTAAVKISSILFAYRSAVLRPRIRTALTEAAQTARGAQVVTITGYTQTDLTSPISRRANLDLARRRAEKVRAYLRAHSVTARVVIIAKGAVNPISTQRQNLNRRVEISARY